MSSLRGLIITAPGELSIQSFPWPVESRKYVRVRVEACGLCTWEQRVYRGLKPTYPFWGGHEVCGVVEETDDANVAGLREGDRVALALMRRCGQCHYCKCGLDNHCVYVRPEPPGELPHGPRGLSDRIFVPPYQVFRLSPEVSAREGALVEPAACVLRSISRATPAAGSTALVMGAGTMGLLHVILLRMRGCRVAACDQDPQTYSHALAAGADLVAGPADAGLAEEIRAFSNGRGVDSVFCVRGGAKAIELGVKLAGRGARIVLFQSIRSDDLLGVSANDLHYREIELLGTISQTVADFRQAADLVSLRPDLLRPLVTEQIGADLAREAFEKAIGRNAHRVMLSFPN